MARVSIWDSTNLNLKTLSKDPSFTAFLLKIGKIAKIFFYSAVEKNE